MSISSEINRIQTAAGLIKAKFTTFGLTKASSDGVGTVSASDTLDIMARAIDLVDKRNQSSIATTITEPDGSVTIPAGYYDGTVSVSANVPVNHYITGETVPASDTGEDGDIYMVV